jgi:phosphoribosylanthranilate isomerase
MAADPALHPAVKIKICGITSVEDAEVVMASGAHLLGLNLIPSSKRFVTVPVARSITDWVRGRLEVIGVVADLTLDGSVRLRAESGVDAFQHHGSERPEQLLEMPPSDFKAVRVATVSDLEEASRFRGPRLLLDAKVGDALGGTGHTFDWTLTAALGAPRDLLLAGGLNPQNVESAIRQVRPWAVDVASGVELSPRKKDPELVRQFVANAHRASV